MTLFLPIFKTSLLSNCAELGTWNFDTLLTTSCVSCVTFPVSCVKCHMSGVTCNMSWVTCNVKNTRKKEKKSTLEFQKQKIFEENFFQSGWASWWRVCHPQGLPRLVIKDPASCVSWLWSLTYQIKSKIPFQIFEQKNQQIQINIFFILTFLPPS